MKEKFSILMGKNEDWLKKAVLQDLTVGIGRHLAIIHMTFHY